jgi:ferric-dicitrate binding protein FerR (iron transport regulator)
MRSIGVFLLFLTAAASAYPAGLPIGTASAISTYSVNDSAVQGKFEVAEGSRLETTTAPSDIRLSNGVDVLLATRSAGRVYADRVELEQGAVRVGRFDRDFSVQVHQLTIQSDGPQSTAVVRTSGNNVEVASLGGSVRVTDGGARLTRVAAGTKMAFRPNGQDAASGQTQTGAKPGPGLEEADRNALVWSIVGISAAAVLFGSIAAAEGKSPF